MDNGLGDRNGTSHSHTEAAFAGHGTKAVAQGHEKNQFQGDRDCDRWRAGNCVLDHHDWSDASLVLVVQANSGSGCTGRRMVSFGDRVYGILGLAG